MGYDWNEFAKQRVLKEQIIDLRKNLGTMYSEANKENRKLFNDALLAVLSDVSKYEKKGMTKEEKGRFFVNKTWNFNGWSYYSVQDLYFLLCLPKDPLDVFG